MKSKNVWLSFALIIIMSSCKFECSVGQDGKKTDNTTPAKAVIPAPKILNDLRLEVKDVHVFSAFLATEAGDLIEANTVNPGEVFDLKLNVLDGWQVVNGRSYLGATQKISTNTGAVVLQTGDLFDPNGLDAADARMLTLKVSTPPVKDATEYYIVEFKVWDKKGTGQITGNYKFRLR